MEVLCQALGSKPLVFPSPGKKRRKSISSSEIDPLKTQQKRTVSTGKKKNDNNLFSFQQAFKLWVFSLWPSRQKSLGRGLLELQELRVQLLLGLRLPRQLVLATRAERLARNAAEARVAVTRNRNASEATGRREAGGWRLVKHHPSPELTPPEPLLRSPAKGTRKPRTLFVEWGWLTFPLLVP